MPLLALTACFGSTETVYLTPTVPEELLGCPDAPAIPTGEYTQREVAIFTTRLAEAFVTCGKRNEAIGDILRDFESQIPDNREGVFVR